MRCRRMGEIRLWRHIRRIGVGVELAVAAAAALVELWMEGDALQSALRPLRLHADLAVGRVDVNVFADRLAVVADAENRSAHRADKQPLRAGLIDEMHQAR